MRRFTLQDSPFILELLNDPMWISGIGDRNIKSISDAELYIVNGPVKMFEQHGFGPLIVLLRAENNKPIGMCGLFKRDYLEFPDIGFAFLSAYCGRGFGKLASEAVISWARKDLQLSNIMGIVSPSNVRSQRLLQSLGFIVQDQKEINGKETIVLHKQI